LIIKFDGKWKLAYLGAIRQEILKLLNIKREPNYITRNATNLFPFGIEVLKKSGWVQSFINKFTIESHDDV